MNEYKQQNNSNDSKYKRKNVIHKYKSKNDIVSFSLIKANKKDINIVGYFKNKQLAFNDDDSIEFTSINGQKYKYKVTHKKSAFIQGYVYVGDDNYIGYIKNNIIVYFILLLMLIFGFWFVSSVIKSNSNNNNTTKEIVEKSDEGITDINGLLHSKGNSHTMSIPQFSSLYIYKNTYVPLINLPENDIMIMYEVYDLDNNLVFVSENPLKPNSEDKWYLDNYESGSHEFIVKAFKVDDKSNKGNSVSFNTNIYILD